MEFYGRTSDNIRQAYEEVVACYDIADKVTTIITEKAANMIKAFDSPLPGYEADE